VEKFNAFLFIRSHSEQEIYTENKMYMSKNCLHHQVVVTIAALCAVFLVGLELVHGAGTPTKEATETMQEGVILQDGNSYSSVAGWDLVTPLEGPVNATTTYAVVGCDGGANDDGRPTDGCKFSSVVLSQRGEVWMAPEMGRLRSFAFRRGTAASPPLLTHGRMPPEVVVSPPAVTPTSMASSSTGGRTCCGLSQG
jgi:hypothetical protein